MAIAITESPTSLFVEDETAWLEATADMIRRRNLAALDLDALAEYLTDMAMRDRREVKSRLVVLLAHLLKWEFQPANRSRGWRTTIITQRQELADLAGRGVLRAHAEDVLPRAYRDAVELARSETGLPASSFPETCSLSVEQLLKIDLPEADPA